MTTNFDSPAVMDDMVAGGHAAREDAARVQAVRELHAPYVGTVTEGSSFRITPVVSDAERIKVRTLFNDWDMSVAVARARNLHRPMKGDQPADTECSSCMTSDGYEATIPADWPCPTARLIYTEAEIKDATS